MCKLLQKNESSKLCFLKPSIVHNGPCSASTTHTCSAIAADLNTVSQDGLKHFSGTTTNMWMSTLPETNIWHLKMNGWKVRFLLGKPIFRCYAGFTKCNVSRKFPAKWRNAFCFFWTSCCFIGSGEHVLSMNNVRDFGWLVSLEMLEQLLKHDSLWRPNSTPDLKISNMMGDENKVQETLGKLVSEWPI